MIEAVQMAKAPVVALHHYDDLPLEVREKLSPETRQALHAVKNDMQIILSAITQTNESVYELGSELRTHNKECMAQKEDLKEILKAVTAVKTTFKVTDFMRNAFLWVVGLLVGIHQSIELWHKVFGA